jgi:hypothetical protein
MNSSEKPPAADVYSGDTSLAGAAETPGGELHFFDIEADSEPGTFARITNVLNIANIAPRRVVLERKTNDATLSVRVEIEVRSSTAQSIQRKLMQLTDVVRADLGIVSHPGTPRSHSKADIST